MLSQAYSEGIDQCMLIKSYILWSPETESSNQCSLLYEVESNMYINWYDLAYAKRLKNKSSQNSFMQKKDTSNMAIIILQEKVK